VRVSAGVTLHLCTALQGMLGHLRRRKSLAIRLSGPVHTEVSGCCLLTPAPAWQHHDVLVLICGGAGVTALLSVLRALAAQRAAAAMGGAAEQASLPRRVMCIWMARHAGEFLALDTALLLAAG
jgi:hypothetical protein